MIMKERDDSELNFIDIPMIITGKREISLIEILEIWYYIFTFLLFMAGQFARLHALKNREKVSFLNKIAKCIWK